MAHALLFLVLGLIVTVVGADVLVRGAAGLALRFGLGPLVIGLTVVAFGTSAPELAVSVRAAMTDNPGIAFGNVVGSNTMNIAVILGVAALVRPLSVHLQVVRQEVPVMLAASALFTWMVLSGGGLSRPEGIVLLFTGLAHVVTTLVFALRQQRRDVRPEGEAAPVTGNVMLRLAQVGIGLGALLWGADLMVVHAVSLAERLGMSPAAIGVTIVACGTSAPELATSVVAAARRQTDIAIGNVVGSNIFNVLFIGGVTGTVGPGPSGGLGALDFGFMLGTAVLLVPMMWTGFAISRREGTVLLAVYGSYLFLIWPGPA